jgi:hypothetical protein
MSDVSPPETRRVLSLSSNLGWRGALFSLELGSQLLIIGWLALSAIAGVADYLAWKLDHASSYLDQIQGRITNGPDR